MKLDLDNKNKFMEFKDMRLGFQPYLQLPSSKADQMNKDQISSFDNGTFQFVPNIAKKTKKKLRKAQ